ncbi:MAG: hypothetical protein OGM11_13230 [Clostridiaceae bacterium]|nr:MAG: hypothetical protein OGM11_13230 [Clostridiaceae bacterium]
MHLMAASAISSLVTSTASTPCGYFCMTASITAAARSGCASQYCTSSTVPPACSTALR